MASSARVVVSIAACMFVSACSDTDTNSTEPTNTEADASTNLDASPTIFAEATKDQVSSAQSDFELCADAIKEMDKASDTGNVGKEYNAAKIGSSACELHVREITEMRDEAKPDFRLDECREAAMAAQDYADGLVNALDAPTAENQGKVETLKSGFSSMAQTCRSPDEYMLSRATKS